MAQLIGRSGSDPAQSEVAVTTSGPGRCEVRGALTFASARRAFDSGIQALSGSSESAIEIDCGGVRTADSAGLAVLLAWLSWARRHGRELRFMRLPEAILAIARISDVDGLLSA